MSDDEAGASSMRQDGHKVAAEENSALALLHGLGIEQDIFAAKKRAWEGTSAEDEYVRGMLYMRGHGGLRKNVARGIKHLASSAAEVPYALPTLYEQGSLEDGVDVETRLEEWMAGHEEDLVAKLALGLFLVRHRKEAESRGLRLLFEVANTGETFSVQELRLLSRRRAFEMIITIIAHRLEVSQPLMDKLQWYVSQEIGSQYYKESRDGNGMTWLHLAAQNGQVAVVRFLAANGWNLGALDYHGRCAVLLAPSPRVRLELVCELDAEQPQWDEEVHCVFPAEVDEAVETLLLMNWGEHVQHVIVGEGEEHLEDEDCLWWEQPQEVLIRIQRELVNVFLYEAV